ncbi:transcriptional regulator FnrL [Sulfitobacter pontiacus]|uniref:transcriptional regulator FnrL n=1 Tax=Sulfitobacter pontiacus TaxID=60137 RepID=UPI0021FF7BA0|nr:Crp/Fnr family transcriptional regulator [Sulfitobacter pontiacus]UWR20285.1 Crp/Fnr family transcriptional regulator [Sulfitobacter pontiacus]
MVVRANERYDRAMLDLQSRPKCSECPIRHRAVCARCDDDELLMLEQIKTYRSFKAGDPMLWRGDGLTYVASVVSGVASLGKTMEDGRTQMVGLLFPSDFIGRPGRAAIDFDVVAVTDVTLCCFQRKPFEALIETTPHIAQRLMEMALDELDAARDWMLLLGRKTAREKIATFIEMLARRQQLANADTPGQELVLPLTRYEIANYLGLTLETVSRHLGAMKKEGILSFVDRRRFRVADVEALHAASGDDCD